MGYALGLMGMWLFSDAIYSLILYKDKGEPFWKCHSIRFIRLILAVGIMLIGRVV